MTLADLLLTPIYSSFGTDATLEPPSASAHAIRAIDRTRGVPVTQNGVDTGTLAPAAAVRAADLAVLGLALDDLRNSLLTMNDKQWSVTAAAPMPGPEGEASGQVIMFLTEYED